MDCRAPEGVSMEAVKLTYGRFETEAMIELIKRNPFLLSRLRSILIATERDVRRKWARSTTDPSFIVRLNWKQADAIRCEIADLCDRDTSAHLRIFECVGNLRCVNWAEVAEEFWNGKRDVSRVRRLERRNNALGRERTTLVSTATGTGPALYSGRPQLNQSLSDGRAKDWMACGAAVKANDGCKRGLVALCIKYALKLKRFFSGGLLHVETN